jgi:carbon storage regulator
MQHSFSITLNYCERLGKEATMLVLTRRIGQAFLIGEKVTVRVLDVSGRQVRIGIEADRCIPIRREELYAKTLVNAQRSDSQPGSNELQSLSARAEPGEFF